MDVFGLIFGWTRVWGGAGEQVRVTARREIQPPPHPLARQRRLLAELRGEPQRVEDLWPAWAELERRRIRRGDGRRREGEGGG